MVGEIVQHGIDAFDPLMDKIRLRIESSCLGRRQQTSLVSLKEGKTDALLDVGQNARDCRLGNMQKPRCAGERACQHDGAEHFDLSEIELHRDNSLISSEQAVTAGVFHAPQ